MLCSFSCGWSKIVFFSGHVHTTIITVGLLCLVVWATFSTVAALVVVDLSPLVFRSNPARDPHIQHRALYSLPRALWRVCLAHLRYTVVGNCSISQDFLHLKQSPQITDTEKSKYPQRMFPDEKNWLRNFRFKTETFSTINSSQADIFREGFPKRTSAYQTNVRVPLTTKIITKRAVRKKKTIISAIYCANS